MQRRPHDGVDPVRADDEVGFRCERCDVANLGAEPDVARRLREHTLELRTVHPEQLERLAQLDAEQRVTSCCAHQELASARRNSAHRVRQTEPFQGTHGVRSQSQTGADALELPSALVHDRLDADTAQRNGSREAADAAADDCRLHPSKVTPSTRRRFAPDPPSAERFGKPLYLTRGSTNFLRFMIRATTRTLVLISRVVELR